MDFDTRGTAAALALAALVGLAAAAPTAPEQTAATGSVTQRHTRNGVTVDFSIAPAGRHKTLMEGEFADVRFRISDAAGGQPIRTATPGAWMDMAQVIQGRGAEQKSCKDKVGLYLKGVVGIRPMLDLNSYFVVLLNNDASISVVDPVVSMAGATSTFASVQLKAPGADWAHAQHDQRLYVSMPRAGQVAVIDTEAFKPIEPVDAGKNPMRVALQPDGRYLWIGNNGEEASTSGVTVIDTRTNRAVGFVATGEGHHEITFSTDSRHAFVSNRKAGTLSILDVATRKLLKQLDIGAQPIALAHSALAQAVYVADGRSGMLSVVDPARLDIVARVALKPGLGPMRATPDGRFVLVLNPQQDLVHVIDVASNEAVQEIAVAGEPFQLAFSQTYAYVRSLHSERVRMINLASLGRGKQAIVQSFAAGAGAPRSTSGVAIADTVSAAAREGSVFVVNPADGTTYFYMEGMNAASSNYRVHGSSPRAVTVVDRSLKEVEPGVFAGRVRIPAAGKYDVAFMLQQPQLLHCFSAKAAANPVLAKDAEPVRLEFETSQREYRVGETAAIRFRLIDTVTGRPRTHLDGVSALYFLAPGRRRTEVAVVELGAGRYEARVALAEAGAWYVHVGVPALKLGYERLPYFSLQAVAAPDAQAKVAAR